MKRACDPGRYLANSYAPLSQMPSRPRVLPAMSILKGEPSEAPPLVAALSRKSPEEAFMNGSPATRSLEDSAIFASVEFLNQLLLCETPAPKLVAGLLYQRLF